MVMDLTCCQAKDLVKMKLVQAVLLVLCLLAVFQIIYMMYQRRSATAAVIDLNQKNY
jgi:cell division protein FtsL